MFHFIIQGGLLKRHGHILLQLDPSFFRVMLRDEDATYFCVLTPTPFVFRESGRGMPSISPTD